MQIQPSNKQKASNLVVGIEHRVNLRPLSEEEVRFEIDMWATANRFKAGHRLRVDISSADFPRFDRNTNRGGEEGPPVTALDLGQRKPDT